MKTLDNLPEKLNRDTWSNCRFKIATEPEKLASIYIVVVTFAIKKVERSIKKMYFFQVILFYCRTWAPPAGESKFKELHASFAQNFILASEKFFVLYEWKAFDLK